MRSSGRVRKLTPAAIESTALAPVQQRLTELENEVTILLKAAVTDGVPCDRWWSRKRMRRPRIRRRLSEGNATSRCVPGGVQTHSVRGTCALTTRLAMTRSAVGARLLPNEVQ